MRAFDLAKRLERARGPRNTRNPRDLPSIAPLGRPGAPTLIRGTSSTSKDTPNRPISGAITKSGTSQSIGPRSELVLHGLEALKIRRCGVMTRVLFKSFTGFRGARRRSRFFGLRAQPWNFAPDGSHLRPLRVFSIDEPMAGERARQPTNRAIPGLLPRAQEAAQRGPSPTRRPRSDENTLFGSYFALVASHSSRRGYIARNVSAST